MNTFLSRLERTLHWVLDRTAGTYIALLLALGFSWTGAWAITTYDVTNTPDMYLDVGIDATQTTGIAVTYPYRNGLQVTFPNTTGAVLEVKQGFRVEHIYASTVTLDSTNKRFTLAGTVTRDLCWNVAKAYTGCGNGQTFSRGATVRLVDDARLFNLRANIDRVNTFIGSGQLTSSQITQAFLDLNSVTNTERNAFTFVNDGNVIYNTTAGSPQYRAGGVWYNFGTGSAVANATDAVAGVIQIITLENLRSRTATGSVAQNVLSPRWITPIGSGSATKGLIPQMDGNGVLSVRLGGNGTGGTLGIASGALLMFQRASAPKAIYAGSNGNVLASDGNNWASRTSPAKTEAVVTAASSNLGASSTAENTLSPTWTGTGIDANTLAAGSIVRITFGGNYRHDAVSGSDKITFRIKIGGTTCMDYEVNQRINGTTQSWSLTTDLYVRTAGAGGTAYCTGQASVTLSSTGASLPRTTVSTGISLNTTVQRQVNLTVQFGTSDGDNLVNIQGGSIQVFAAP